VGTARAPPCLGPTDTRLGPARAEPRFGCSSAAMAPATRPPVRDRKRSRVPRRVWDAQFESGPWLWPLGLVHVGGDRRKGDYMTTVLCHCRVADYDAWRRGYDHALKVTPGVRSFRAWRAQDDPSPRDGRGDFPRARAGGGGMDVGRDTGGNGGGWHRHVIAVGLVLRRGRRRRAGSRIAARTSVDRPWTIAFVPGPRGRRTSPYRLKADPRRRARHDRKATIWIVRTSSAAQSPSPGPRARTGAVSAGRRRPPA
jgi:hypothetical protein